jgi:hypothetical protein
VPENRVLRKIFGTNRNKVTREWRKLHNGELHVYSFQNIIRQIKSSRIRYVGHVVCMGQERKLYKVLMGRPEGKRPLGRLRQRWENGIKMDLRMTGWESVEWIHLAQDRDQKQACANTAMNLQILPP